MIYFSLAWKKEKNATIKPNNRKKLPKQYSLSPVKFHSQKQTGLPMSTHGIKQRMRYGKLLMCPTMHGLRKAGSQFSATTALMAICTSTPVFLCLRRKNLLAKSTSRKRAVIRNGSPGQSGISKRIFWPTDRHFSTGAIFTGQKSKVLTLRNYYEARIYL